MELWIRSQDRTILTKNENIYLDGVDETEIRTKDFIIGQYQTKERALEVLDEIHNMLKPKGIVKIDGILSQEAIKHAKEYFDNQYIIFNKNMELLQQVETYVYEMPLE